MRALSKDDYCALHPLTQAQGAGRAAEHSADWLVIDPRCLSPAEAPAL